jgi:5-hydroxyisourate hydrolase-like protein (transthyretin family)
MKLYPLCILLLALLSLLFAQSYRCDWQVVASGGGEMAGTYHCAATTGQTATGLLSGPNLLAYIGFWYPDIVTGIDEKEPFRWETNSIKETRLYPPVPNPFTHTAIIRYTLNTERQTLVQVCDITGRVIRTLANSTQKPGRYRLVWDGRDNSGRAVASGVYLCRFVAGDYQRNTKLILQH